MPGDEKNNAAAARAPKNGMNLENISKQMVIRGKSTRRARPLLIRDASACINTVDS
jgi:hypothetical protein